MLEAEIARTPALADWQCVFTPEKLTGATAGLAADATVISIFVNSRITADILAQLPSLKLIVTRSTGFDHIDGAAAAQAGIAVTNIPAYGPRTVAEYTFALILALSRKIVGDRHGMGFDLQGKTIGIVGTGRIGQSAAQLARGFDMNVLAYDVFQDKAAAEQIGFSYVALDALLAESDIVSLHVPRTKDTENLINLRNISKIKKGALLINPARGEVIETAAIEQGLREGIFSGAGLDIVAGDDSALAKMPNVILTPHNAYHTVEAVAHIAKTAIENIAAFAGGKMQNKVN